MKGILLINTGTPDAPTVPAVRRYLRQFLSDPRVIDLPILVRKILLELVILPFRPRRSAEAYKKIWTEQGSPLLIHAQSLTTALQQQLGKSAVVALGMRYGNPSIASAIESLCQQQCSELVIVPLFPQYASAATGSAIAESLRILNNQWNIPKISIIREFYQDSGFLDAQASLIQADLKKHPSEKLIFSYHGLPERHINKSCQIACQSKQACPTMSLPNKDCYRAQCYATSHALAERLSLKPESYITCFQSRLGRTPWIEPFTDDVLSQYAKQGVKKITVTCPSFVADCLETLEEINIRAQSQWLSLGGEELYLVPCLNAEPAWVTALANIIQET